MFLDKEYGEYQLLFFINKKTGDILRDEEVNDRIAVSVEKLGADAWFSENPQKF